MCLRLCVRVCELADWQVKCLCQFTPLAAGCANVLTGTDQSTQYALCSQHGQHVLASKNAKWRLQVFTGWPHKSVITCCHILTLMGAWVLCTLQVGGNWLAWWIVLAAAASQIGQFQAEMSSDSYQLQGMAERGFLPKALASRSKHGTPTYGILLSSLGVMCLASFSFVDIVELLNAIYCLAELLEFAAYIWLRIRAPNLPRPYK